MKKLFMLVVMAVMMLASVANASMAEKVAQMQSNAGPSKTVQIFIDSKDGTSNFEQKVLDNFVMQMKTVFPANFKVLADTQFFANVDLYREDKLEKLQQENASNQMVAAMMPTASYQLMLSREDWAKICNNAGADYVMYIRIDKGNQKAKVNYANAILFGGLGGINTQVEMDVTTRLFSKDKADYTYLNRQRVTGKVHGDFAPDTAAKRALPKIIPNIHLTDANF